MAMSTTVMHLMATDAAEVAPFLGAFNALRQAAVTGDEARRLLTDAAAQLG